MLSILIQPVSKISGGGSREVGCSESSGQQRACSQAVLHLVRYVHFRYITIFCFLRSMCSLVCKFNYMGHDSQLHEGKWTDFMPTSNVLV